VLQIIIIIIRQVFVIFIYITNRFARD